MAVETPTAMGLIQIRFTSCNVDDDPTKSSWVIVAGFATVSRTAISHEIDSRQALLRGGS
jgi:hypothetical protein